MIYLIMVNKSCIETYKQRLGKQDPFLADLLDCKQLGNCTENYNDNYNGNTIYSCNLP